VNLHGIVSGAIATVNPPTFCTIMLSNGYTIGSDGTQIPAYQTVYNIPVDVQALSYTDLMKIGGLNIEGTRRKLYLNGSLEGVDRQAVKGGDLVIMPDLPDFRGRTTWLVTQVLEWWPDWCSCAATLQLSGS
jgi:hypothetical protein